MITDTYHFKKQSDNISDFLLTVGKQPKTIYVKGGLSDYSMSREGLDEWYRACFKAFPLNKTYISDEVSVDSSFRHYFLQYHKSEDFNEESGRSSTIVEDLERDSLLIDLEEYISEWIENLFHDFAELVGNLKSSPVFACINDDLIIMKNLLKFYKDIRQSEEQQLLFFHRIALPKFVTDQMTDILIELLADKISMLSGEVIQKDVESNTNSALHFKINWLASQQEFVELVHELTQKGYWHLPDLGIAAQAQNLSRMFDFSSSQRKKDANIAANILANLSPILDKKTKETTYAYLKPNKKRNFSCIPTFEKGKTN